MGRNAGSSGEGDRYEYAEGRKDGLCRNGIRKNSGNVYEDESGLRRTRTAMSIFLRRMSGTISTERYFSGFYRPGSALSYLQGLYDTMTVPWLDRSICECIALCLWNRNNITGPAEGKQHGTAGRMCHRIAAVRMGFGAHRMVRAGSATKGCFLCCLFLSRLYRAICIYMYCYIPY